MKSQLIVIILTADLVFCVLVGVLLWVLNRNPEAMLALFGG